MAWSLCDWLVHTKEDFMSRLRVHVPLALALAVGGTVALGATTASAAPTAPAAACTSVTPPVQQLSSAVTSLGAALSALPPDPVNLSQTAGSLIDAVTAAVNAGCLPALPTPSSPVPANAQQCLADEVQLLEAALGVIAAGVAAPPNLTAALQAATALVSALTSINSDACLPISLPVPTVPAI
jgi:hypothetical protein